MVMSVLLVYPPVNRLYDLRSNYFPLGLGYLAAIANQAGIPTKIYNAEREVHASDQPTFFSNRSRFNRHELFKKALKDDTHRVWMEFKHHITEIKPRVIGFSCTSSSLLSCLKMAKMAKEICSPIVVFGGVHPTICPEETAQYDNVDYIVGGNAEPVFNILMSSLLNGKSVRSLPGVGGRINGDYFFNDPQPDVEDLDIYPFPDRDSLVDFEISRKRFGAIIASRGCPFQCTFCSGASLTKRKVRYRSVTEIVREMNHLKNKYEMEFVQFYDDAFGINKLKIQELCKEIRNKCDGIMWGAFVRADTLDKETLNIMRDSGCVSLGVGVESGSTNILKRIRKGYSREQALSGIEMIKKSGISVTMNIMIGFPFETSKDIRESISLIKKLRIMTNVNTFTPYPQTELYDECVRRGLIKGSLDWATISQHSLANEFIDEISHQEYRELLNEMLDVADGINRRCVTTTYKYVSYLRRLYAENDEDAVRFGIEVAGRIKKRLGALLSS